MAKSFSEADLVKLDAIEKIIADLRDSRSGDSETISGQVADKVAEHLGSWRFLLGQGVMLAGYVVLNLHLNSKAFDPYPFILLNLMLSFQAAFTAPIILMAQNRVQSKDRRDANRAYHAIAHIEDLVRFLVELEGIDEKEK